ncbi:MAG: AmmeMemoRadiSam system radical SAM enzyme [Eubacteriaceae bacterium]|nr:AmmeMemoRadiSam system radical SAM enzyme [Eubacteriaceae bacterium]
MKEAAFYEAVGDSAHCQLCPHFCRIKPGASGICKARENVSGKLVPASYGQLSSIALDPIEKKPLRRFYPGSQILSVGSYGCSMHCSFCQNYAISQQTPQTEYYSPDRLLELALSAKASIGVAFTYNEPFVAYEYLLECAQLLGSESQKVVAVTNGLINSEPLRMLLPFIHALNIDIKSFRHDFYTRHGGDLDTVKAAVKAASQSAHVEATTLIIPGQNDTKEEMGELASWLAEISPDIPLHISRFFPRYKMAHMQPTPVETVESLAKVAQDHLLYVYKGNL